jgi:hypothetical protein
MTGEEGEGERKVLAVAHECIESFERAGAVAASERVHECEDGALAGIRDQNGKVGGGDGPAEKGQLFHFDRNPADVGGEGFHELLSGCGLDFEVGCAGDTVEFHARFRRAELTELNDVGDGSEEFAEAIGLRFILAFEIPAGGFEDQGHAGSRVSHVGVESGGIAAERGFVSFVVID